MGLPLTDGKTIGYVGEFKFPEGDAYSQRALGLGKILRAIGMNVFFQGLYSQSNCPLTGISQDFKYANIKPEKTSHKGKISKLATFLQSGYFSRNQLLQENTNFDIIILAGGYSRYLVPYLSLAKQKKMKLLVDVVEWFDYAHLPLGKYGPFAWDVHYALTHLIPQCDGVIGISSYLSDYYSSRGVKSIRIPQLVDMNEEKWNFAEPESFDSQSLNLVYAGVPGRKDLIGNAVRAIKILKEKGHRIKLHLFGPSLNDMRFCLDKDAPLVDDLQGSELIFHGRIAQQQIPAMLAKADFSILLRPDARYANAGFPTKLVESFAAGVPIIANLTSDIGMYLRDNDNGIVLKDWSVEAFANKIMELCAISDDNLRRMRLAARAEAEKSFDYRNYISSMTEFMATVNV